MRAAGFDIGTTTICCTVVDVETGAAVWTRTLPNDTWVDGKSFERLQDPERIWEKVRGLYQEALEQCGSLAVIGLTGQMHGIVYVDGDGNAVSPLYTWQDERGEQAMESSPVRLTYAAELSARTGYDMATGYGLTTHYYNERNHLVPERAATFCPIHAYVGMKFAGRKTPLVSASDAAGLGCFCLKDGAFDREAVVRAGMDPSILPEVERGFALLGETGEHIPVSIAIGDNQASVLGSVRETDASVLVNIGTSSQISVGVKGFRNSDTVELRPVAEDDYLFVGAGLCGGRAYALLEQFFAKTVEAMTGRAPEGKLYGAMERMLRAEGFADGKRFADGTRFADRSGGVVLTADTRFCGTRKHPELTGGFFHLTWENFTPADFAFAVLNGIADELVAFYQEMRKHGAGEPKYLIGSGNAVRSNEILRRILERRFGMPMRMPSHREEASYGAALFALVPAGICGTLQEAQRLISYEEV